MKISVTKSSLPSFEEYCEEIKTIWETRTLTNYGDKAEFLKKQLSSFLNTDNLELFVNGHSALECLIQSYSFEKGGEIITTPFTFVSTTNCICRCGLIPVFCDILADDYTIDPSKIEKLITPKTVAILGVHVYGNICRYKEIEKVAKKHNLVVLYDAAHAFGESVDGINVSQIGDASMFSFHATKVFNSIEGGCVTFSDSSLANKMVRIRNFGLDNMGDCLEIGSNYKMNEFQASMGICNLRHIDEYISNRKKCVERYINNLKGIKGIILPKYFENVKYNYSYFPVVFDGYKYDRNQIHQKLAERDIFSRKYFYPLTSKYSCFSSYKVQPTPIAESISEKVLTLPLYPDLTKEEIDIICNIIKE